MRLERGKAVWVEAKIVDPPDHLGFIKVAIPTGYVPEPEQQIEIHANSVQGFTAWAVKAKKK